APASFPQAMSPLVVDIQPTIGEKIIAPPMESEISTFNGDIAFVVDQQAGAEQKAGQGGRV
ncbi:MAG: hypothetical protein ABIW96_13730, partial [Polaromonas sp.]